MDEEIKGTTTEEKIDETTEDTMQDSVKKDDYQDDMIFEIPIIKLDVDIPKRDQILMKIEDKMKLFFHAMEVYLLLFVVYEEVIFHFARFGFTADNIGFKILFALLFGFIMATIISACSVKVGNVLKYVFMGITSFYFMVQTIYSGVFKTYLSLMGTANVAGQAFDYTDVIWHEIKSEWWLIILQWMPFFLFAFVFRKYVMVKRSKLCGIGIRVACFLVAFILCMVAMKFDKDDIYTAYETYKHYPSVDLAVKKLGVMEALWLDVKFGIKDKTGLKKDEVTFVVENNGDTNHDNIDTDSTGKVPDGEETPENQRTENQNTGNHDTEEATSQEIAEEIDTSPNVLDLDFDVLIEEETDANIKALHTYISTVTPTNKNEYTGMFEGYNLIFVVAEGFSGYVIDKERTPLLYNMSTQGFHFNNYYTPLWYGSTVGGEYADLTGLMPKNGSYLSMNKVGRNKNDMMFTLANQLNAKGYTSYGFHDNDYTYYDRNNSHPVLGYNWIGMGNGLTYEKENGSTLWPQSDLSMIQNTFDLYKDEEPFHVYYLTVSGHVMYNFGGNAMAKRHQDIVEDLSYSDTTKAYIACQYELELAMEALVADLEMEGLAENTLIVLTADHVPYDNKDVVDELAGYTLDNTFGWYKNTLIIWSASMDKKVEVDKYCCSLDVLPTVSNLMGLPYDSRMLVGQDIMSDSEGLVIFNDHSFLTDTSWYNANTGQSGNHDGSEADAEYIQSKNNQVKNKFSMAESICNYNYYKYVREALNGQNEE